ncbi:spermidine/putrescine transport system permease protein [Actinocorallia herbida]|uniref:Spermidine/putrescine transport system permease protein n=1 Tax=Actinocorallia herbida TaxID=58109 RepID=A0A3N1CZP1_9ACTN|nr:ABC transporter permease [Actinocorallia herbida]ROO86258.1 spermidine/putrescine transport system permease protein [Actinocorallia herbida]
MKRRRFRVSLPHVMLVAVLVFFYVPIGKVIVNAFNADESLNTWGGATLRWFREALGSERVRDDFLTSASIAGLSTVIAVVLSVTAVMGAAKLSQSSRRRLQTLTYARMMLPEVVIAVGLLLLIRRLDLTLGLWSVVAGHVIFCSAYATLVIQARFATLKGTYDEAAADLGAPPWRAFVRVLLPMLLPAIAISSLLSFTFSFDDVVSTVFLAGPETETLPILILGMSRQGVSPDVNAIAVSFMAVTMLALALFGLASWWRSRSVQGGTARKDSQ